MIASSQITPQQKQEIIFFERNGLRHGEFTLRDDNAKVIDMQWNSDSEILGILLKLKNEVYIHYNDKGISKVLIRSFVR